LNNKIVLFFFSRKRIEYKESFVRDALLETPKNTSTLEIQSFEQIISPQKKINHLSFENEFLKEILIGNIKENSTEENSNSSNSVSHLVSSLLSSLSKENLQITSFTRTLWMNQLMNYSSKETKWHPSVIKHCLLLAMTMNETSYNILRGRGSKKDTETNKLVNPKFNVLLPSWKYLQRYRIRPNYTQGIAKELFDKFSASFSLKDQIFGILLDERNIQEAIKFDKQLQILVGFTEDIHISQIFQFDERNQLTIPKIANKVMIGMLVSVTSGLCFPLAIWHTRGSGPEEVMFFFFF
jgi:hypothetical protein